MKLPQDGSDDGVPSYNRLNGDEQLAILDNVQIYRGLKVSSSLSDTASNKAFEKAPSNAYSFEPGYMPSVSMPVVITELISSKYENISMELIGGLPGEEKSYPSWVESLIPPVHWQIADITAFYPTILLLARTSRGGILVNSAENLMRAFSKNGMQPFIDMYAYATKIDAYYER